MVDWFSNIFNSRKAKVCHTFILAGNTKDLYPIQEGKKINYIPLEQYLVFCEKKERSNFFESLKLESVIPPNLMPPIKYTYPIGWMIAPDLKDHIIEKTADFNCNPMAQMAMMDGNAAKTLPTDPSMALNIIHTLLSSTFCNFESAEPEKDDQRTNYIIFLDHAESLFASPDWSQNNDKNCNTIRLLNSAKNILIRENFHSIYILVRDNYFTLHPAIRRIGNDLMTVWIPYPNLEDRREFVTWYLKQHKKDISLNVQETNYLINKSSGMNLITIQSMLNHWIYTDKQDSLEKNVIKTKKEYILTEGNNLIESVDPIYGRETVGGLNYIFDALEKEIYPLLSEHSSICPAGILFMGPPGTGKSVVAEAIAKECNFNFVKFNINQVFHCFVGSSEANMEQALQVIQAIAPCIVWIDEIDQIGYKRGGYQGDSGVSSRVFGRLLAFMADQSIRGNILFIGATNRPDLMDAAMKRSGRFDWKIPFMSGNEEYRESVIHALCRKHNLSLENEEEAAVALARFTEGFVGSDLETLLLSAFRKTLVQGNKIISTKLLKELRVFHQPSIKLEDLKNMSEIAINECDDLTLAPPYFVDKVLKEREKRGDDLVIKKVQKI